MNFDFLLDDYSDACLCYFIDMLKDLEELKILFEITDTFSLCHVLLKKKHLKKVHLFSVSSFVNAFEFIQKTKTVEELSMFLQDIDEDETESFIISLNVNESIKKLVLKRWNDDLSLIPLSKLENLYLDELDCDFQEILEFVKNLEKNTNLKALKIGSFNDANDIDGKLLKALTFTNLKSFSFDLLYEGEINIKINDIHNLFLFNYNLIKLKSYSVKLIQRELIDFYLKRNRDFAKIYKSISKKYFDINFKFK